MADKELNSAYKPKAKRQRKSNNRSVSLSDVAKHAKVSTATVSRVLNNPEKVADKKREQILAAIDELGYIPDGAARALASRRTRTIGAVVPTLDNAIFAAGIQALQSQLKQLGYTLIVASHEYNIDEELHEVKTLLRQGIEAVMVVGSTHHDQLYQLLEGQQIPFVCCWAANPDSPHPYIGFDNRRAAQKMTDYLLDLGHREFAVIAGHTRNNDRATERLAGTRQALEAQGIELDDSVVLERAYSVKQGREAMRILLQNDTQPTAVVCGNDVLALGALAECQASGIRVPEEISITGFDDLDISAQLIPALTTIHVPSAEMGKRAADFLAARIKGETTLLHTEIGVDLMIRDTTGKPKTND